MTRLYLGFKRGKWLLANVTLQKGLTPQHYYYTSREKRIGYNGSLKRQKTIQRRWAKEEKQSKMALHI